MRLALSWSGGKDSAFALWTLRGLGQEPETLLTTVTEDYGRVSIHGVRRELLAAQAAAVGVPVLEVLLPAQCSHDTYQTSMVAALTSEALIGVDTYAFADLFLEDVRAYRITNLAKLGKRALFPMWGLDTRALAREFIGLGFRAVVVTLDPRMLASDFAGREFDNTFLDDLPEGVDPCGENGEFHTFVFDGPVFDHPVGITPGDAVVRNGFVFQDLSLDERRGVE